MIASPMLILILGHGRKDRSAAARDAGAIAAKGRIVLMLVGFHCWSAAVVLRCRGGTCVRLPLCTAGTRRKAFSAQDATQRCGQAVALPICCPALDGAATQLPCEGHLQSPFTRAGRRALIKFDLAFDYNNSLPALTLLSSAAVYLTPASLAFHQYAIVDFSGCTIRRQRVLKLAATVPSRCTAITSPMPEIWTDWSPSLLVTRVRRFSSLVSPSPPTPHHRNAAHSISPTCMLAYTARNADCAT